MSQTGQYGDDNTLEGLRGDTGGDVFPDSGIINIIGGTDISVAGNPGTSTLTVNFTGAAALTFVEDSGSAASVAGSINVFGTSAQGISTSGTGQTVTITASNATAAQKGVASFNSTNFTATSGAITSNAITVTSGNNITATASWNLGGTPSIAVSGTTNHAVQIGNASGSLTSVSVGATGTVLAGNTAADPTFQALSGLAVTSITGTANQIAASASTGPVTLSLIGPYTPATYTSHGVLYGNNTSSIGSTAEGATGTVLIGTTAGAPSFTGSPTLSGKVTAAELQIDNIDIDGNTISSTDANGNIVIAPNGNGVVSVTAAPIVPSTDRADSLGSNTNSWDNVYADGLTFDDGANILSTYVATTSWTPVLQFGGASVGITYASRPAVYTRIGNTVTVAGYITLSNKGSSTGTAEITGLPFPVNTYSVATLRANALTFTGQLVGSINAGNSAINIETFAASVTVLTDAAFSNSTEIDFSFSYVV